jgi:tRNA (guanine-N7-)-methyltransferase
MGKQKMYRYATVGTLENVVELNPTFKGRWAKDFFGNTHPIILELACGKGHYTLELARRNPNKNYIGVDIKGERIFVGARFGLEEKISNAGFLRTQIEDLHHYFDQDEVAEIWITFPDPYLRKPDKRLTSPRFLDIYKSIVTLGAIIHLKTDDPTLHEYTLRTLEKYSIPVLEHVSNVYATPNDDSVLFIQTHYEKLHLKAGRTIRYLNFNLDNYNPPTGEHHE